MGIRTSWNISMVPAFLQQIEPVADRNGVLVSAYGSTMRYGVGRDLDLIVVPKRLCVDPAWIIRAFCAELDATTLCEPEPSLFCDLAALIELKDTRLIDVQVRLSRNRMDALDMYESGANRKRDYA